MIHRDTLDIERPDVTRTVTFVILLTGRHQHYHPEIGGVEKCPPLLTGV